jgi:hypothetical protein
MAGLVLRVLSKASQDTDSGNCEKRKSSDFQPELVQHPSEGICSRTETGQHGLARPALLDELYGAAENQCDFSHRLAIHHYSILAAAGGTMKLGGIAACCRVPDQRRPIRGGFVDQQLKQLMKELGEAINESLSDSESIAEVVARIKEGGYDIFLVLEATIGVSKQGEHTTDKTSLVSTLSTNAELKISDQDLKFLKSLRIKIEDDEEEE